MAVVRALSNTSILLCTYCNHAVRPRSGRAVLSWQRAAHYTTYHQYNVFISRCRLPSPPPDAAMTVISRDSVTGTVIYVVAH